ncbi:MAG: RNA 2',3'-cyclic phosphodiesterase [bacterium]
MRRSAPPAGGGVIRTFVALEFDPAVKQAIAEYLQPLEMLADGISWVKSRNLHLTLKFLGDTQAAQIPELAVSFGAICSHYDSIRVQITGSGAFPDEKRPRVLWLGLKTETDALNQLAKEIDRACMHFGFQPESRSFAPHLTIGRVRNGAVTAILKAMRDRPFSSLATVFHECILMKSELQPAGSIYTPLHKFPLARGGG